MTSKTKLSLGLMYPWTRDVEAVAGQTWPPMSSYESIRYDGRSIPCYLECRRYLQADSKQFKTTCRPSKCKLETVQEGCA